MLSKNQYFDNNCNIIRVDEINREMLVKAAYLVYQSLPEYYNIFHNNQTYVIDGIIEQLKEKGSELGESQALVMNESVIGIYSFYNSNESTIRQSVSLKMMVDHFQVDNLIYQKIKKYKNLVDESTKNTLYLSRISVNPDYKRQGFGGRLLKYFESHSEIHGINEFSLHVRKSNQSAISFYKKNGYVFNFLESDKTYRLMVKSRG